MSVQEFMNDEEFLFYKNAIDAFTYVKDGVEQENESIDPGVRELYNRFKGNDNCNLKQSPEVDILKCVNINQKLLINGDSDDLIKLNSIDYTTIDGNGGKKVKCSQCGLTFKRLSELKRHEKSHLPILSHICSQCGKGFARKDALKRHFNTLTCKRNRTKLLYLGNEITELLNLTKKPL